MILFAALLPGLGSVPIPVLGLVCGRCTGRFWTLCVLAGAFSAAAIGLVMRGGYPFELRPVLNFGNRADDSALFLHVDPLSVTWILFATWIASLFHCQSADRAKGDSQPPRMLRLRSGLVLCLVSTSSCAVLTMNVWWQWGAVALSGWLLCGALLLTGTDAKQAGIVGPLTWLTAADLLWLVGLSTLQGILGSWDLHVLSNWPANRELNAAQWSLGVVAAGVMLLSLLIRLGLFPCSIWTASANVSGRHAAWVAAFGFGQGVILLSRWTPVLTPFAEFQTLLLGMGGLSAVLLAVSAWAKSDPHIRCLHIAGGQLGLVAMGIAAVPEQEIQFSLQAIAVLGTLGLMAWELDREDISNRISLAAAILLCVGAFGHEAVFDAIQTMSLDQGRNPWPLLAVGLFGHGLMTYSLFQMLAVSSSRSAKEGERRAGPNIAGGATLLMLLALTTQPIWIGGRTPDGAPFDLGISRNFPVATLLVMLIALTAARLFPAATTQGDVRAGGNEDSFRRLGREDFYVEQILTRLVVDPLTGFARAVARVHDAISDSWTELPRRLVQGLAEQAEETDEETTSPASAAIMIMTALVLMAAILLGRLR